MVRNPESSTKEETIEEHVDSEEATVTESKKGEDDEEVTENETSYRDKRLAKRSDWLNVKLTKSLTNN